MGSFDRSPPADTSESGSQAPPQNGTRSDYAYLAIQRLIREGVLAPGKPLIEQHLAQRISVSRTPLRQALQRLESEGLLVKSANRSHFVRTVELKEYLQSLRVRETLEAEAAALAAGRVPDRDIARGFAELARLRDMDPYDMLTHWRTDDLIHGMFISACGNDVMTRMLLSLRVTTQLFEIDRLATRLEPDTREHEAILTALRDDDAKGARRAVAAHMRSLFRFAVKVVA